MFSLTRIRLSPLIGRISQLSRTHIAQSASARTQISRVSSLERVTSQADRLAFSTSLIRLNTANTTLNAGASGTTSARSGLFGYLKNGMQIVTLLPQPSFFLGYV